MADVELIATRNFSYATRRLKAGDRFTVPSKMAKVLVGIRRAEEPRKAGSVPPPPASLTRRLAQLDHDGDGEPGGSTSAAVSAADEVKTLRAEYLDVVGKRAFNGWDAATLREKIAAAKQ